MEEQLFNKLPEQLWLDDSNINPGKMMRSEAITMERTNEFNEDA